MTDLVITPLELRFPNAGAALAVARAISGNPDVETLPPDGQIGGVRYDIAVVNGDGRLFAPAPDEETPGELIPGYHVIGLWHGPPETVPEELRAFMLAEGTLGVRFG